MNDFLPFKIGQVAESKSFEPGFRGAWFRCKIMNISSRKGDKGYFLEFFDFPDEKVTWTRIYQKPPMNKHSLSRDCKRQLMIRPSYPILYRESEVPDLSGMTEVVAIANDVWKVGDMVDWFSDGCYWSAKIVQVLEHDKVKIVFPEPPLGEGNSYEAQSKDLRPSLNWSLDRGWSVPMYEESPTYQGCVLLIHPISLGGEIKPNKRANITDGSYQDGASVSSNQSSSFSQPLDETNMEQITYHKTNIEGYTPDLRIQVSTRKDPPCSHIPLMNKKNIVHGGWITVKTSDPIESSIVNLEELVNKIKWLKEVLNSKGQHSAATLSSWKCMVNLVPFNQR